MSKWIAEFDLEDGDTMPEHMDLDYMGAKIDFHCRPMWIPVSERLPELNQNVIVTYNKEDEIRVDISYYSKHGFWIGNVVAWMPLPEPMKVGEENC
jgi:hypothetical protein